MRLAVLALLGVVVCDSAAGQVLSVVPGRVDRSALPPMLPADAAPPPVSPTSGPFVEIGMSFPGANIFDSGFIPPDTMGAIGPTHFVELINGTYAVFDRADGSWVEAKSLNRFWIDAGTSPEYTFDPRVLYDKASGRWFAVSADAPGGPTSSILVAVSNTTDPTDGWMGFRIDADSDDQQWADFPTMGIDADAVYVSANMFAVSSAPFELNFWVLPKGDLMGGSVANMTAIEGLDYFDYGFALQPVVDLDGGGLPTPILAEYYTAFGVIARANVLGPLAAPSMELAEAVFVDPYDDPPEADQPGSKPDLNTSDARFGSFVLLQGGSIWGVQTVDNGGRAAIRWLRIDPATNEVAESGLLSDPNLDFFYPSIAVNDDGEIVVGCSGSGPAIFAGAYAFAGRFSGTSTEFGPALLLRPGTSDYALLDGIGRNRWGDYSATMVDPNDPKHFWTIQEYVASTDLWGTWITELIFDDPACSRADVTTFGAGRNDPGYGVPDGIITASDLLYFLNAWIAFDLNIADVTTLNAGVGDPGYGVPDGVVTAVDLNFFVNLWVQGCP